MPVAHWHDLKLADLLVPLLCCERTVHLSSTCGALHPLSTAVNSTPERRAGTLVVLCCTAMHNDLCAYSEAFSSRGTHAERDLRTLFEACQV